MYSKNKPKKDFGYKCFFCGGTNTYFYMDNNHQWYPFCEDCAKPNSEQSIEGLKAWAKIYEDYGDLEGRDIFLEEAKKRENEKNVL